jgi:hypothetical protein
VEYERGSEREHEYTFWTKPRGVNPEETLFNLMSARAHVFENVMIKLDDSLAIQSASTSSMCFSCASAVTPHVREKIAVNSAAHFYNNIVILFEL